MSLWNERAAAARDMLAKVRQIEGSDGVTREALAKIGQELVGLATRTEFFPLEQFPVRADGGIYRISEDPDHRFALYASAGAEGKLVPPHNHTTWACIAGVHGQEHNVRYSRVDDGRNDPEYITLERGGESTIVSGNVIEYLPDDFHTIQVPAGGAPALHLHLYGLSLEHLPDRVTVEQETGRAKRFMAKPKILTPLISAQEVKAVLGTDAELAFFDAREEGEFNEGHPLFATPLPLSKLEQRVRALLPSPDARIVLMDSGEEGQMGRANRAAARLSRCGYGNVAVMDGGLKAWRDAGYEVFGGVNVPSKAFGEVVEHDCDTPRIEAADLKQLVDEGKDLIILDSRPMDEFRNMSIPGGIDCPGAELVYRVKDFAPNPETLVVVNCAGRTRSIIGAQSLINAGLPNKVIALKNGTMGWHLAGLQVARGRHDTYRGQSQAALGWAREAAARVAQKAGIRPIPMSELRRIEAAAASAGGSVYKLDVRDPAEYAKGHLIGFRHAPGGQLVQATDHYVGVRNATIVLHDSDGVRATMTAHWLVQMGWQKVHVLKHRPLTDEIETGPERRPVPGLNRVAVATIEAPELKAMVDAGEVLVVDLDTSIRHRDGHVPGAWFAVRAGLGKTLPEMLAQTPGAKQVVLVSPDGVSARLAAADVIEDGATTLPVMVLQGGMRAWRDSRLPIEKGQNRMADPPTDVWYRPYDRAEGVEAAMNQYLTWEVDLVGQVQRDGDARFNVLKM
ncbi:rhodanese-like domain-containing protein [Vineibacter terrae]|uniref:rhodanese-like domain-containing protein n=1 Tax=Vineibacter terrae TaxID=2586908 RepID=UPI002E35D3EF|nr:rhodanese-like domain-containing protein [Vineibacter terrae]HEX2889519.1 rhodanese-like domain-containing protein [Vineibacter terrae]